jgi:adenylate cyclase class IV
MHEVEKKYRISTQDKPVVIRWARTILVDVQESILQLTDFRYNIVRNKEGADFERLRVETTQSKCVYIYTHKYTQNGLRHEDETQITHDQAQSAVAGKPGLILQKLRTQIAGRLNLDGLSISHIAIDIDEVVGMEDEAFVEIEILTEHPDQIAQLESYIDQIARLAPINLQPERRSMMDMSRPYTVSNIDDLSSN